MKFRINGKTWRAKFRPWKQFAKRHPGCIGICDTAKKRLEFPLIKVNYETIAHEVCHAFLDECCLGHAVELKKKQLEEAYCELFSKFGTEMLDVAQAVFIEYYRAGGK